MDHHGKSEQTEQLTMMIRQSEQTEQLQHKQSTSENEGGELRDGGGIERGETEMRCLRYNLSIL